MVAVAQISFFSDPQGRAPEQLLQAWPAIPALAEAATLGGAQVTVIQANAQTHTLSRDGIDYHFLPCDREPALLQALLQRLQPDVLHVQGLGFVRDVPRLAAMAPGRPILLQHRAERPPRRPWNWLRWRRSMAAARGLMFCTREHAAPFERWRLVAGGTRIYEAPGSTCHFIPQDREEARAETGLHGDPCLLWVANLDANKDPLTVLDAVTQVLPALPGLQLWCCYGRAPLLPKVQERLNDPRLAGRVHLLGTLPHARMQALMSAADFLVQGSHRESTGFTAFEAMACGLPPLITAIPSFKSMVGPSDLLWRPGDAAQLASLLMKLAAESPDMHVARRLAARQRFEANCSPAALGQILAETYLDLLRS